MLFFISFVFVSMFFIYLLHIPTHRCQHGAYLGHVGCTWASHFGRDRGRVSEEGRGGVIHRGPCRCRAHFGLWVHLWGEFQLPHNNVLLGDVLDHGVIYQTTTTYRP